MDSRLRIKINAIPCLLALQNADDVYIDIEDSKGKVYRNSVASVAGRLLDAISIEEE